MVNRNRLDDGWKHLSTTRFPYERFEEVTHIWFSHEHPDHFSPADIRSIPAEFRERITVLYKQTKDKKVVNFCQKLGFKEIIELPPGKRYSIGSDLQLTCNLVDDDSLLCIDSKNRRVLNLNDCVIKNERHAEKIKRSLGSQSIDVLMTQFSYASWAGNVGDSEYRKWMADEKLDRIAAQIEVFEPKFTIPFASFVWFCHKENYQQNTGMNTVQRAAEVISRARSTPIVLYPGDVWLVGADRDNSEALNGYASDYNRVFQAPKLTEARPVPVDELVALAADYYARLRADNGPAIHLLTASRIIRPARIFIEDRSEAYRLSATEGLRRIGASKANCDIALSSSVLANCFKERWGWGTLQVNGRFSTLSQAGKRRFDNHFRLAESNNHGRRLPVIAGAKIARTLAGCRPTIVNQRIH